MCKFVTSLYAFYRNFHRFWLGELTTCSPSWEMCCMNSKEKIDVIYSVSARCPYALSKTTAGKYSFVSTVTPTVLTKPSRKRSFWKTLFKARRNLKAPAFRLRLDGRHFENGAFPKR